MEQEADVLKLAEAITWKLDLLQYSGSDLQKKLNEIPGWENKWNVMDEIKRKKSMIYIFKQIAVELRQSSMPDDMLFIRLFRDMMATNTDYDMDKFLLHAHLACKQWEEIRSRCGPATTEEIDFFGFNKRTTKAEAKSNGIKNDNGDNKNTSDKKSSTSTSKPTSTKNPSSKPTCKVCGRLHRKPNEDCFLRTHPDANHDDLPWEQSTSGKRAAKAHLDDPTGYPRTTLDTHQRIHKTPLDKPFFAPRREPKKDGIDLISTIVFSRNCCHSCRPAGLGGLDPGVFKLDI